MIRSIPNSENSRWLALCAATFALAVGAGPALAMETGVYQVPDIGKFLLVSEEDRDGDGDEVKETHILQ